MYQFFESRYDQPYQHQTNMAYRPGEPSTVPKQGGIYEVGYAIDIYSKVDELS